MKNHKVSLVGRTDDPRLTSSARLSTSPAATCLPRRAAATNRREFAVSDVSAGNKVKLVRHAVLLPDIPHKSCNMPVTLSRERLCSSE